MRGKEYLVAIIAEKGILRAETLRFSDELRSPADIGLPEAAADDESLGGAERSRVRAFEKGIEALAQDKLDREALEDRHSQKILERVRKKLEQGEDVIGIPEEPESEAEQGGEVVDLMQVLKQSLAQGQSPVGKPSEEAPAKRKSTKEPKKPAKKAPRKPRPATRRKAKPKSELAGSSKNELYERAQQLGIAGRSGMSKEQLIEAIGDAE